MTVDPISSYPMGFGLAQNNIATLGGDNSNDRIRFIGGRGFIWMRTSETDNSLEFYAGSGASGKVDEDTQFHFGTGTYDIRLIYDTTVSLAASTATLQIDSGSGYVTIISNAAVDLSNVNYVGYDFDDSTPTGPTVDNFLLTTSIPEPSSVMLGALGAIGLMRRKRA